MSVAERMVEKLTCVTVVDDTGGDINSLAEGLKGLPGVSSLTPPQQSPLPFLSRLPKPPQLGTHNSSSQIQNPRPQLYNLTHLSSFP